MPGTGGDVEDGGAGGGWNLTPPNITPGGLTQSTRLCVDVDPSCCQTGLQHLFNVFVDKLHNIRQEELKNN